MCVCVCVFVRDLVVSSCSICRLEEKGCVALGGIRLQLVWLHTRARALTHTYTQTYTHTGTHAHGIHLKPVIVHPQSGQTHGSGRAGRWRSWRGGRCSGGPSGLLTTARLPACK